MIIRLIIAFGVAVAVCVGIIYLIPDVSGLPTYYAENLRGSLFTGFLTVGSFLLSLNTLVVVRLKENVFDSNEYKLKVDNLRKVNPKLTRYGPVKRLNTLLFISICATLGASVLQLTIGLITCWVATIVCIFSATFALCMLVMTLLVIRGILNDWLNHAEHTKG